jgi:hypothetical protein
MSAPFKGVKAFFAGVELDAVKELIVEGGGQVPTFVLCFFFVEFNLFLISCNMARSVCLSHPSCSHLDPAQAADRYSKSVTHIIFSGGTEQQITKAVENNVPVVSPDWVAEYVRDLLRLPSLRVFDVGIRSKKAGALLDVSKYFPEGKHAAKTSKPKAAPKKKEEKVEKKEKEQKSADIAGVLALLVLSFQSVIPFE